MQAVLDETAVGIDNELPPQIEIEEDMKLREADKPWFRREIREAIRECMAEEITPLVERKLDKSWRFKAWPILLNVGVIAIAVSTVLTLFIFALNEHSAATIRLGDEKMFEGTTKQRLDDIDKHLQTIDNSLANFRLNALNSQPITRESVAAVQEIVLNASNQNIQLDHSIVNKLGVKLIAAADNVPTAWSATTVLLGYTSAQNKNWLPSDAKQISTPSFETIYQHPAGWEGQLKWAGMGESPNVPQLHQIGFPDDNAKLSTGPSYLIMEGGVVRLDGMIMKRIVVRDATVVYQGGPASLQSVYFVNCKFEIQQKAPGQMFATAIFSDPSINFNGE